MQLLFRNDINYLNLFKILQNYLNPNPDEHDY
jgi:hypothetical protein